MSSSQPTRERTARGLPVEAPRVGIHLWGAHTSAPASRPYWRTSTGNSLRHEPAPRRARLLPLRKPRIHRWFGVATRSPRGRRAPGQPDIVQTRLAGRVSLRISVGRLGRDAFYDVIDVGRSALAARHGRRAGQGHPGRFAQRRAAVRHADSRGHRRRSRPSDGHGQRAATRSSCSVSPGFRRCSETRSRHQAPGRSSAAAGHAGSPQRSTARSSPSPPGRSATTSRCWSSTLSWKGGRRTS